jgi:hypothetical protein
MKLPANESERYFSLLKEQRRRSSKKRSLHLVSLLFILGKAANRYWVAFSSA